MTKAHSRPIAERLVQSGWTLVHEFRHGSDPEPYEFYLEWREDGQPPEAHDVRVSVVLPEYAVVRARVALTAALVGGVPHDMVTVPEGTVGAIVMVYPGAYEVEFVLPEGSALATVQPEAIELTD